MALLTPTQIAQYAYQAGFRGTQLVTAVAIALAESGGNTSTTNSTGNSAGVDRGLFQINSYYHSEVSDTCAFDPACNAAAAYRISSNGTNFSQWTTYTKGIYTGFINTANTAVQSLSGTLAGLAQDVLNLFNAVFGSNITITQPFGCTSDTAETPSGSCPSGYTHLGVDYAIPTGTQLPSLLSGTVTQAGWNPAGYGNSVTVATKNSAGQTVSVLMGHMQSVGVTVGQTVQIGSVLGLSDNTGNSTGPHVHVGEQVNGSWVDPTALIKNVLSGAEGSSAPANVTTGLSIPGLGDLSGLTTSIAAIATFFGDITKTIFSVFQDIGRLGSFLASGKHWIEIGFITLGLGLILSGSFVLLSDKLIGSPTAQNAVTTAVKVAA